MSFKGKLVFASGRSVDFDIFVLDLESGRIEQLTTGDDWNDQPRWSPDGKQIAFLSNHGDGISSLWTMDADGRNARKRTSGIQCQHPSWSPDGQRLIFTANAGDPDEIEICSLSLAEGTKPEILLRRKGQETEPSLSPDGDKLVFSAISSDESIESRFNTEIWEYDLLTRKERRLTSHAAKDYAPVYSPDGEKIAFVSRRHGLDEELYLEKCRRVREMAVKGSVRELNEAIREVTRMEADSDIFVMNADGTNVRQMTHNSHADVGVRWSPCGNYLIYTSGTDSKAERIKVIDASFGEIHSLHYDRGLLLKEIGAETLMNKSWFQKLVPDAIERLFADRSFWGEERHPDWTYNR